MATIYTVGHGARNTEALISILKKVGIETLLAGIAYDWLGKALGGYRTAPYAEHMKTESNPEQCHRFHIADWLVGHGHRVVHLLALERAREHALHPQEDLWRDV